MDIPLERSLEILHKRISTLRHNPNKIKEDYEEAYVNFVAAFKLLDISFPTNTKFTAPDKYRIYFDKFLDEFCILAFYMNLHHLGLIFSDRLIFSNECKIDKNQIIGNQRFYVPKLNVDTIKLDLKLEDNWYLLNPSIILIDDFYLVNCRMVNYTVNPNGSYTIYHNQSHIYTRNIMLKISKDFKLLSNHELIDKSEYSRHQIRSIFGFEDLILFNWNGGMYASGTSLDTNPHGVPEISLGELDINNNTIISKHPLGLPNNRSEKNWLPIIKDDQLYFIYEYHPFTIKQYSNNKLIDVVKKTYPTNLSRFKGSAAPILFDYVSQKGYLFIIHETFNLPAGIRCYLHRFIFMNLEFEIKMLSHPWYLHHHGIEFCRSMCWSHGNKEIIITYGIHDKEAYLGLVNPDDIKAALWPLEEFMF